MESTPELRKLQLVLLQMFIIFDNICRDNNIHYVMFGGTLLGAVRHKGFIPWDNDIDVAVSRSDFEKLERLLLEQLPTDLKVQTTNTDRGYINEIMRIRNPKVQLDIPWEMGRGQEIGGAFLDIFPLDNARREKSIKITCQAFLVKWFLGVMINRSAGKKWTNARHDLLKNKIADLMAMTKTRQAWVKIRKNVMMWEYDENTAYYINLCSHYNYRKQVYLKNKIFPAKLLQFEGHSFYAPSDYNYVLTKFYGTNYMEIPDTNDRHIEEHIMLNLKVGG